MRIIVQKFGGTSVADPTVREQAAAKIIKAKEEGYAVVVVVSAMGRKGAPYATDTLIGLAKEIYPEIEPREYDLLLSCGEIISTVVMVQTLRKAGYRAVAFSGANAGIHTDNRYSDAEILAIDPTRIKKELEEGKIVVVAGFQGISPEGDVTTLGRGGSDTTATALGVALEAEVVEIYTDVDGVMSVDPKIVSEAKALKVLTYREICEMANQGAKVVHPRAVQIARDKKIPVKVRSTFTDHDGTLITDADVVRVITGITQMTGLTRIKVYLNGRERLETEAFVLRALAEAGVSIDLINISSERMAFVVKSELAKKVMDILKGHNLEADMRDGCAKISLIGAGMQDVPGVMATVVETLRDAGVKIIQTADSEITISCLIPEESTEVAVKTLYDKFDLCKNC